MGQMRRAARDSECFYKITPACCGMTSLRLARQTTPGDLCLNGRSSMTAGTNSQDANRNENDFGLNVIWARVEAMHMGACQDSGCQDRIHLVWCREQALPLPSWYKPPSRRTPRVDVRAGLPLRFRIIQIARPPGLSLLCYPSTLA